MRMLLYVVYTAGEFVWKEGGVVQLPAPYIALCDFFVQISSILVEISRHTEFQLPRLPRSGRFMVGDNNKKGKTFSIEFMPFLAYSSSWG